MESGESPSLVKRIKKRLTGVIGYLLPLIGSMPPLVVWGGMMTVPFATYLVLMMLNIFENPPLPNLAYPVILGFTIVQIAALGLLVWSILYRRSEKYDGLVTKGPYRLVRHPQYFSLIILTLLMTYQSVWILLHTNGYGWLTIDQTKIIWIGMLAAYTIIGAIEEIHLEDTFEIYWHMYIDKVGFLIPFVKSRSRLIEMLSGILVPYAILEIMLYFA